jgi:hypothetical protein
MRRGTWPTYQQELPTETGAGLITSMPKAVSDILGRWRIIEMEGREPNDGESEVQPFIQFTPDGSGEFSFGCVQGFVDHRLLERDRKPGVEWTWHGNDEMDDASGRGWAVLDEDRCLRGMLFIHQGDESGFVAKKVGAKKAGAFGKSETVKPTARQGQFLAFICHYTKLNGQAPAERDMEQYFKITAPSVHQMVVTLERKKLIERTPGVGRSIRLLVPREQLPDLE